MILYYRDPKNYYIYNLNYERWIRPHLWDHQINHPLNISSAYKINQTVIPNTILKRTEKEVKRIHCPPCEEITRIERIAWYHRNLTEKGT